MKMKCIGSRETWNRRLRLAFGAALVLGMLNQSVAADSCCKAAASSSSSVAGSAAESLREKWGIEIASLRMSGQGYFVDFRYKVLDPEKAAPLANKDAKPYLIDEASGKELRVPTTPKLGALRQTAQSLVRGNIYFMFFGNRSAIVKSGSKVTVVVGDIRLENLTIQ